MDEEAAPDLRQYLAVLRRRKATVVLFTLAATVAAVVLSSRQEPIYSTSAQVLLESPPVDPLAQLSFFQARELNNEIRELESTLAREAVAKSYQGPLPVSAVSASVVAEDADVIRVGASGGDPEEVARLVNTYVDAYLKFRTDQQVAVLLETGNALRPKVEELRKRITELNAPLVAFEARVIAAPVLQRPELERQRNARVGELAPQLDALQTQLGYYQEQLDKVELSAGIRQSGALRLLAAATVPSAPVSPKPTRNALAGLVIGLLLGVGVAFAREHLDDTLRDKATLESVSRLPTLGVIPRLRRRKREFDEVVTISAHTSVGAEAFRTLRTSVKFLTMEDDCRVFQITSATASEGKTLTAMNLAVALTQAGDRTIVVGCDLRRPRLDSLAHAHVGRPGLTSVLVGDAELHEAIERHEAVDLAILRTGPVPADPSELLSSTRTRALIQALRGAYDYVILDCPPLLPVSDSLILATYSDASLLVVSEGRTSCRNLSRALELLRQVNAPLRGTILNGTRSAGGYGYGYGYGYSYSQPASKDKASRRSSRNGVKPEESERDDDISLVPQ